MNGRYKFLSTLEGGSAMIKLGLHHGMTLVLSFFCVASSVEAQRHQTPVTKAWEEFSGNRNDSPYAGLAWTALGPMLNSGRVETLDVVPGKPGTLYVGFGSGNLWKTENHGFSWKPIFDDHAGYSIGDVRIAPSDPDIVYLGTGENLRAKRGHTFAGSGVYRSNDAGETWIPLGLEDTYHIGRVAVHPRDADIVFVAALGHFYSPSDQRGLFKSADGGKTWKKVLYVDDRTGASDVLFAPTDPKIMYATTWQCSEAIGGPGSGVYASRDGGETWTRCEGGLPSGAMNGRAGLAVSHQDCRKVFAFVDNLNLENKRETGELYRTGDGGETWTKTHEGGLKILSTFGHVFMDCVANPRDDREVYLLGINILRSGDDGKTFASLRGKISSIVPSPANFFHVDHHDLWIDPEDPDHLIVGNDGGIYITYDHAESWFHYNNLPVGEFYFVRTDDERPYRIYSGTQDNAAVFGPAVPLKPDFGDHWNYVWIDPWSGGDGIVTCPDPEDPDIVYYESQNGDIRRKRMSTNASTPIKPRLPESHGGKRVNEWLTPFFVSDYNHATLYYGANFVFKSVDRGNHWEVISPDLSRSADEARRGGAITALRESPTKRGLLYAGTAHGALWVSGDDGVTWTEISRNLPAKYVKSILPSAFDPSRVYVSLSGIKEDDFTPMVFLSEDRGGTWTRLAEGLPGAPVNVIVEDPEFEDILYLGTFDGVLVSTDRGETWNVLGRDMPHGFVADMTIQRREKDLIAATHGRGIYQLDLEPVHALRKVGDENGAILHVTEARLPRKDASGHKPDFSTHHPIRVDFFIPKPEELKIAFIDLKKDRVVHTASGRFRKGTNSFYWDLVVKGVENDNPYLHTFVELANRGDYRVRITGESTEMDWDFVLREWEEAK